MPGENKEGRSSEEESEKLPWWKRGLKVIGGLVGQAATGVLGMASIMLAIGCIAAMATFPVGTILGAAGAYVFGKAAIKCGKGFEAAGKMRKEGWTGQKQNSNGKNYNGQSQSRGQSNEQENSQQKDNLLVRAGKTIAGIVEGIFSGAIGSLAFLGEGVYNLFAKEKTNAVSSKWFNRASQSFSLAKEGLTGTKSLESRERHQSFTPEKQMQENGAQVESTHTSRETLTRSGNQQGAPQYTLYPPGGNDASSIRETLTRSGNQQSSSHSLHMPGGKTKESSAGRSE